MGEARHKNRETQMGLNTEIRYCESIGGPYWTVPDSSEDAAPRDVCCTQRGVACIEETGCLEAE
jgi:hypothetical protein